MATAEIPPALLAGIKETLACVVIGGIVGTTVYGITVLQTYIYYRRYARDPLALKSLVGVLFVLDSVTTALIAYGIYEYLVLWFMAPVENFLFIPRTLSVENGLTVLIGSITQCFFAQRLLYFSKNKYLAASIVCLSVGAFGSGMALTVHLFTDRSIFSIGSLAIRVLAGFTNGLSVVCDLTIATGLCYYLRSGKSGFTRTNNMVDRLMVYAVQRGALTAMSQAAHMITTVALPGRFLFLPFAFMQGKLYCNTLLATLNVRDSLKNSGKSEDALSPGSRILASIPRSPNPGRRANDRQAYIGTESSTTLEFNIPSNKDETSTIIIDHEFDNRNKV
ncbi:hypothetical protein C8Q74DRAFT_1370431 [Fomes fomentarius]|nr:hypothetical protein C8Q74DRAFT_1370431 [Fomes fomentarius]